MPVCRQRKHTLVSELIVDAHQLTSALLTKILMRNRALLTGSVQTVELQHADSVTSRIVHLHLSYEEGSTGSLPAALMLKMCAAENTGFGPSEVYYYTHDYVALAHAPIPVCYDSCYSAEQQRYHILMDDLSGTHRNNWEIRPTRFYGEQVARAAATLHAFWWDEKRLAEGGIHFPVETDIERYIAHIRPGLIPLLEDTRGVIDPSWAAALSEIFEQHPAKMLDRLRNKSGYTLLHGDLNPGNILSPRADQANQPDSLPTYFIDRQPFDWSLTTWLGVSDISYVMVHWWEPEIRRALEYDVLSCYHDALLHTGVNDYTWEELLYDYKLCAVQSIYVAVEWCVLASDRVNMRWVWLPQLQRSMTAFFDLHCAELWS